METEMEPRITVNPLAVRGDNDAEIIFPEIDEAFPSRIVHCKSFGGVYLQRSFSSESPIEALRISKDGFSNNKSVSDVRNAVETPPTGGVIQFKFTTGDMMRPAKSTSLLRSRISINNSEIQTFLPSLKNDSLNIPIPGARRRPKRFNSTRSIHSTYSQSSNSDNYADNDISSMNSGVGIDEEEIVFEEIEEEGISPPAPVDNSIKNEYFFINVQFRSLILVVFIATFFIAVAVIWAVMWSITSNLRNSDNRNFQATFNTMATSTLDGLSVSSDLLARYMLISSRLGFQDLNSYMMADVNLVIKLFEKKQLDINTLFPATPTSTNSVQSFLFSMFKTDVAVSDALFVIRTDDTLVGYDKMFSCISPVANQICMFTSVIDSTTGKVTFEEQIADSSTGNPNPQKVVFTRDYNILNQQWFKNIGKNCLLQQSIDLPFGIAPLVYACPAFDETYQNIIGYVVSAKSFLQLPQFAALIAVQNGSMDPEGCVNSRSNLGCSSRVFMVDSSGNLLYASNGAIYGAVNENKVKTPLKASASSDLFISQVASYIERQPGGYSKFCVDVTLVDGVIITLNPLTMTAVNSSNSQFVFRNVCGSIQIGSDVSVKVILALNTDSSYFSTPVLAINNGQIVIGKNFEESSSRANLWMGITALISVGILAMGILIFVLLSANIVRYLISLQNDITLVANLEFKMQPEKIEFERIKVVEIESVRHAMHRMRMGLESFSKFVPRAVVRQIVSGDKLASSIYFENRVITVMFSDVANFTTICDTVPIDILIYPFVEYLTNMTNVIEHMGGTVGDYMGDGILAYWGAPVTVENHAIKACTAALLEMRMLQSLNSVWEQEGGPPIWCRIGINTGEVLCGNIGSPNHLKYDVIGAEVNFGSRLECLNKKYGTSILLSESTYEVVKESFLCRPIDTVCVVGMARPSRIYELLCTMDEALPSAHDFVLLFTEIFNLYTHGEFELTITRCDSLLKNIAPNDKPSMVLRERSVEYMKNPPELWTGVTKMDSK